MKSSLLQNKMYSIQTEYKELLKILLPIVNSRYAPEALDEITLFWARHIEEVRLFMSAWIPEANSYVFTASTFLDYDDREHLPFLLMGYSHILDDPLSRYAEIFNEISEGEENKLLYREICITIEDNLKLLQNVKEKILILPLRLLTDLDSQKALNETEEQIFVSFFNGINSIDDYFSKCNSINDIKKHACEDIERIVLFSEEDNQVLSFEKRFQMALEKGQYPVESNKSDSYNFFLLFFGYIKQALDVIVLCVEYGCVPYIRHTVSLHYITLLMKNYMDEEQIALIRFKMCVAFIVYNLCDKDRLSSVQLHEFVKVNQEYDFNAKLYHVLAEKGIDENSFLGHPIRQIVLDELEQFYEKLSEVHEE